MQIISKPYSENLFTSKRLDADRSRADRFRTQMLKPNYEHNPSLGVILGYVGECNIDDIFTNAFPLYKILMMITEKEEPTKEQSLEIADQLKMCIAAIANNPKSIVDISKTTVAREHEKSQIEKVLPYACKYQLGMNFEQASSFFPEVISRLDGSDESITAVKDYLAKIGMNEESSSSFLELISYINTKQCKNFFELSYEAQVQEIKTGLFDEFKSMISKEYKNNNDEFKKMLNRAGLTITDKSLAKLRRKYPDNSQGATSELLGIVGLTPKEQNRRATKVAKKDVKELKKGLKKLSGLNSSKDDKKIKRGAKEFAIQLALSSKHPTSNALDELDMSINDIAREMSGYSFDSFSIALTILIPIKHSSANKTEEELLQELNDANVINEFQSLYTAGISEVGISGNKTRPSDFLKMPPHRQNKIIEAGILKAYTKMRANNTEPNSRSNHSSASLFAQPEKGTGELPTKNIDNPGNNAKFSI